MKYIIRIAYKDGSFEELKTLADNAIDAIASLTQFKKDILNLEVVCSDGAAMAEDTDAVMSSSDEHEHIDIYTDGACSGNPGPAGAGFVIVVNGKKVHTNKISLGHATNNIAEILAASHGLNYLPANSKVRLFTDSLYVINTITKGWKRKANNEYWTILDSAIARHKNVNFIHVKAHNGDEFNELADSLAVEARLNS